MIDNETFTEKITKDLCTKIVRQKEELIHKRLEEQGFTDLLSDIANGATRRFPKMVIENHPDREEYWVDNGTIEGHLLITFFNPKFNWNVDIKNSHTLTSELKYK